jgi:hypothetical protein
MIDDGIHHVGGHVDAIVAFVHEQADVRDDGSSIALRRPRDLRRLTDHGAVLDVDVAVTVGGRGVEDGDVDGRDAIAQLVALDGDDCCRPPTPGRSTRGSTKVPIPVAGDIRPCPGRR